MAKNHKTIEEIVAISLENIKKNNITLDEFCKTFKVDKCFIEALLDPTNEILINLTKLVKHSGFRMTLRKYRMKTHAHSMVGEFLLIERLIEPKCNVNYDFVEQRFFRFRPVNKKQKLTIIDKQNIMHDFQEYLVNRVLKQENTQNKSL